MTSHNFRILVFDYFLVLSGIWINNLDEVLKVWKNEAKISFILYYLTSFFERVYIFVKGIADARFWVRDFLAVMIFQ